MEVELDSSRGLDHTGLKRSLIRSIAHASIMDGPGALGSVLDAAQTFIKGEQTPERLAWSLWRESLSVALAEFCRWDCLTRKRDEWEVNDFIEAALDKAHAVLEDTKEPAAQSLDLSMLIEPSQFPIYGALRTWLVERISEVDPDLKDAPDRIAQHFDHCFEIGLRRAWVAKLEEYEALEVALSGSVAEGVRMRKAWAEHHERIRRALEDKPVFGQPEDSPVTLSRLYTPSRCHWHIATKTTARDRETEYGPGAVKRIDIHISELHDAVDGWLRNDQKDDAIRIIAGGPGSGKSTFANMLALKEGRRGEYDTLLVPLQGMGADGLLRDRIGEISKYEWLGGFPDNPVRIDRPRRKKMLLIFDGLDEIAQPGDAADDLTKKFILNVRQLVREENRERIAVKAVVLGRSTSSQEACRHAELTSPCLLHVAPMTPMADNDLFSAYGWQSVVETPSVERVLHDEAGMREQDRRETYWSNWCEANGTDEPTPQALTDETLTDLSAEPLLCYLLILSDYTGDNWTKAAENRNRVYRRIFHKVYRKEWSGPDAKHSLLHDTSEAEFLKLLSCLGIAAWLGGGRTGTDEDFEQVRADYDDELNCKFQDLPLGKLKNVAVQFYLREDMGAQPGYEFLHKSFGEYLAGRGLIDKAIRELGEYKRRPKAQEFVKQWLEITGDRRVTNEMFAFMVAEARLRDLVARGSDDEDPEEDAWGDAEQWCTLLSKIVDWTLRHGVPAHAETGRHTTWREVELRQRNAELALWCTLSAFGRAAFDIEEGKAFDPEKAGPIQIDWPEENTAASLALRIMGAKREPNHTDPFSRCLAGTNLSGQRMAWFDGDYYSLDGARLDGARLDGARLNGAILTDAILNGARLNGARLDGARLNGARLNGARLDGARLNGARLTDAILNGARLDGAILTNAILNGARLNGARLNGAILDGARLNGARLNGAILDGARLDGARLDGANCRRVRIDSCRLQFADLSGVEELSQEAVNRAYGNSATKLPDYLKRPDWPETKYGSWREAFLANDPDG